MLANGASRAEAIAKTINDNISPEVQASILQLHIDATIIVNKAAESEL